MSLVGRVKEKLLKASRNQNSCGLYIQFQKLDLWVVFGGDGPKVARSQYARLLNGRVGEVSDQVLAP